MNARFNVAIFQETPWFVAKCLDNSVASQGKTVEEALLNLKEALALYYEDDPAPTAAPQAFLTTVEVSL